MIPKVVNRLSYLLGTLGMVFIFLIMVMTTADVTKRFTLGSSLGGSVEVSQMLLVGMVFLALAWAEVTNSHVRVDLIFERLPRKMKPSVNLFARLICFATVVFLVYATILYAESQFIKGEVIWAGTFQIQLWPARFSIVLGLIVFCILILVKMVIEAKSFAHREGES